MIAQVRGKVVVLELTGGTPYVIIDTGGVSYKVFISPTEAIEVETGKELLVWTHLAVRENAQELFGFRERETLEFFELLISISGIGPRGALGILGVAPISTLREAISSGDTSYLTKVSGIGKKTAQKVVLELKDKIGSVSGGTTGESVLREDVDVLEALKSLGYSHTEAREALKHVPNSIEGVNNRIKEALKIVGEK